MEQLIEANNNRKTANSALANGENTSEDALVNGSVHVYGHGPAKNPFYEEARATNMTSAGALLILSIPVNRGQKLLLISVAGQDPAEAEVVRTRALDTKMFEVEVAFPVPQLEFWKSVRGSASGAERRRSPRVGLTRGMTISWEGPYRRDISRVSSLSLGGLFIEAEDPAPAGQILQVQFDIPCGPVLGKAVVRRSIKGKGMGVEFTELPAGSRAGINELLRKLLGDVRNRRS
jgi:PilZ domain-containing protein